MNDATISNGSPKYDLFPTNIPPIVPKREREKTIYHRIPSISNGPREPSLIKVNKYKCIASNCSNTTSRVCSKCQGAIYCGQPCEDKDWPNHRKYCEAKRDSQFGIVHEKLLCACQKAYATQMCPKCDQPYCADCAQQYWKIHQEFCQAPIENDTYVMKMEAKEFQPDEGCSSSSIEVKGRSSSVDQAIIRHRDKINPAHQSSPIIIMSTPSNLPENEDDKTRRSALKESLSRFSESIKNKFSRKKLPHKESKSISAGSTPRTYNSNTLTLTKDKPRGQLPDDFKKSP